MLLCLLGCWGGICFAVPLQAQQPATGLASTGDFSVAMPLRQASAEGLGSSGVAVPLLQPVWGVLGGGWVGTPTCDAGGAQAGWLEAAATPN